MEKSEKSVDQRDSSLFSYFLCDLSGSVVKLARMVVYLC